MSSLDFEPDLQMIMVNRYINNDSAADLIERRWFAAVKAASKARVECETLLESLALTQAAWGRARARLTDLEALRDALGDELEASDVREERPALEDSDEVMTAA